MPSLFRTAILERLRLPLDVTDATCTCGGRLDSLVRHRGSCLGCQEAGAVVRTNMKLRDMNIVCPANDDHEIKVVASGLRLRQGAQLGVDGTLRSATSCGAVCTNAANMDALQHPAFFAWRRRWTRMLICVFPHLGWGGVGWCGWHQIWPMCLNRELRGLVRVRVHL